MHIALPTTKMLTNLLKARQPTRALSSLFPPAQSPASTNPKGRRKEEQLLANSALPWAGATDPCVPIFKLLKSTHISWVFSCTHKPSCFSSSLSQTALFTSKEVQFDVRLLYTIAGAYITAKFYQLEIQIGKLKVKKQERAR